MSAVTEPSDGRLGKLLVAVIAAAVAVLPPPPPPPVVPGSLNLLASSPPPQPARTSASVETHVTKLILRMIPTTQRPFTHTSDAVRPARNPRRASPNPSINKHSRLR